MIKLCIVGDGLSLHTQRWMSEMLQRNFEVSLITDAPVQLDNIQTFVVPRKWGSLSWFSGIFKVRKIVRSIQPDIIHGHYITSYGLWAMSSPCAIKVLTAWGSDLLITAKQNRITRFITRWIIQQAHWITADSQQLVDEVNHYHAPADEVQWGIEFDRVANIAMDTNKNQFRFISLRLWKPVYHIEDIIQAFATVCHKYPDIPMQLCLLAGGILKPALNQLVDRLSIRQQVKLIGAVSEADMLFYLKNSDVSITIPESDGTSMSLLESMAMKLPVIASDLPANHEWLTEQGAIFISNVDTLSQAMETLLLDENLRHTMGNINYTNILERANRQTEMNKVAEKYTQLVTSN